MVFALESRPFSAGFFAIPKYLSGTPSLFYFFLGDPGV
jgi:hypothetical protein